MEEKNSLEKLKVYLEKIAAKEACIDDKEFNAYDYSGGNFDDAYYKGTSDGKILLARELLKSNIFKDQKLIKNEK